MILFSVFKCNIKDKKGRRLYYPRVVSSSNLSTQEIAEEMAQMSSLSTGDVKNLLDTLSQVVQRNLMKGHSVTLDGMGRFYASIKSRRGGAENPEDVMPTKADLTVRFSPFIKRAAGGGVASRSMVKSIGFKRVDKLSKKLKPFDKGAAPSVPGGGTPDGNDL